MAKTHKGSRELQPWECPHCCLNTYSTALQLYTVLSPCFSSLSLSLSLTHTHSERILHSASSQLQQDRCSHKRTGAAQGLQVLEKRELFMNEKYQIKWTSASSIAQTPAIRLLYKILALHYTCSSTVYGKTENGNARLKGNF